MAGALYLTCAATACLCSILLLRGYRRSKFRLLLWSGFCFALLTLDNLLVFVDLLLLPDIDLRLMRLSAAVLGLAFLLYGLIWEGK